MLFFVERKVTRNTDPTSDSYNKIVEAKADIVCTTLYDGKNIPIVGEIIVLENGNAYDVINVIVKFRNIDASTSCLDDIFVEVKPHDYTHKSDSTYNMQDEHWPLISELLNEE